MLGNYWSDAQLRDDDEDGISDVPHRIGSDDDENPLMESPDMYPTFSTSSISCNNFRILGQTAL